MKDNLLATTAVTDGFDWCERWAKQRGCTLGGNWRVEKVQTPWCLPSRESAERGRNALVGQASSLPNHLLKLAMMAMLWAARKGVIVTATHPVPRSRGLVDFLRVAGTISEGRLRYSRRKSMPESVRNLRGSHY